MTTLAWRSTAISRVLFAYAIQQRLRELGLRKADLVTEAISRGLSATCINEVIGLTAGRPNPTMETIEIICRAAKVDTGDILSRVSYDAGSQNPGLEALMVGFVDEWEEQHGRPLPVGKLESDFTRNVINKHNREGKMTQLQYKTLFWAIENLVPKAVKTNDVQEKHAKAVRVDKRRRPLRLDPTAKRARSSKRELARKNQ